MTSPNPYTAAEYDWTVDSRPRWERVLSAGFHHLALTMADTSIAATMKYAGALGGWAQRLSRTGPTARAVRSLFSDMPPGRAAQVAQEIAAGRFRNQVAIAVARSRGPDALWGLLTPGAARTCAEVRHRESRLFVTWHVGAMFGVGMALRGAGLRLLVIRDLPLQTIEQRAAALKGAIDELRAGTAVLAVPDGPGGTHAGSVTCLGRDIVLRRGAFMLARVTGVPVTPIVASWGPDGEIGIDVGPALPVPSGPGARAIESAHAAAAARWLEDYLTRAPGQIWLSTLSLLRQAPISTASVSR